MKKTLVIISGPSGVGKTTLIDILVKKYNFIDKVVTCTTRSPRDLEQNGVDYYFLSVDTANKMISNGDFIEHKTIYGNIYGCSSGAVDYILNKGRVALICVDVEGARSLMQSQKYRDVLYSIFIDVSSDSFLLDRLKHRNEKDIDIRIKRLVYERRFIDNFDHVVINDVLEDAVIELGDFINSIHEENE